LGDGLGDATGDALSLSLPVPYSNPSTKERISTFCRKLNLLKLDVFPPSVKS
jgi:hypothetical protein